MWRVMVVDDDANMLSALRRGLQRKKDFKLDVFDDPVVALEQAKECSYDVIVADYSMPNLDGIAFLTALKQYQPRSIKLILSGYSHKDLLLNAINQAHACRFIEKPCDGDRLANIILEAMDEHERFIPKDVRGLLAIVREQDETIRVQSEEIKSLRAKLDL